MSSSLSRRLSQRKQDIEAGLPRDDDEDDDDDHHHDDHDRAGFGGSSRGRSRRRSTADPGDDYVGATPTVPGESFLARRSNSMKRAAAKQAGLQRSLSDAAAYRLRGREGTRSTHADALQHPHAFVPAEVVPMGHVRARTITGEFGVFGHQPGATATLQHFDSLMVRRRQMQAGPLPAGQLHQFQQQQHFEHQFQQQQHFEQHQFHQQQQLQHPSMSMHNLGNASDSDGPGAGPSGTASDLARLRTFRSVSVLNIGSSLAVPPALPALATPATQSPWLASGVSPARSEGRPRDDDRRSSLSGGSGGLFAKMRRKFSFRRSKDSPRADSSSPASTPTTPVTGGPSTADSPRFPHAPIPVAPVAAAAAEDSSAAAASADASASVDGPSLFRRLSRRLSRKKTRDDGAPEASQLEVVQAPAEPADRIQFVPVAGTTIAGIELREPLPPQDLPPRIDSVGGMENTRDLDRLPPLDPSPLRVGSPHHPPSVNSIQNSEVMVSGRRSPTPGGLSAHTPDLDDLSMRSQPSMTTRIVSDASADSADAAGRPKGADARHTTTTTPLRFMAGRGSLDSATGVAPASAAGAADRSLGSIGSSSSSKVSSSGKNKAEAKKSFFKKLQSRISQSFGSSRRHSAGNASGGSSGTAGGSGTVELKSSVSVTDLHKASAESAAAAGMPPRSASPSSAASSSAAGSARRFGVGGGGIGGRGRPRVSAPPGLSVSSAFSASTPNLSAQQQQKTPISAGTSATQSSFAPSSGDVRDRAPMQAPWFPPVPEETSSAVMSSVLPPLPENAPSVMSTAEYQSDETIGRSSVAATPAAAPAAAAATGTTATTTATGLPKINVEFPDLETASMRSAIVRMTTFALTDPDGYQTPGSRSPRSPRSPQSSVTHGSSLVGGVSYGAGALAADFPTPPLSGGNAASDEALAMAHPPQHHPHPHHGDLDAFFGAQRGPNQRLMHAESHEALVGFGSEDDVGEEADPAADPATAAMAGKAGLAAPAGSVSGSVVSQSTAQSSQVQAQAQGQAKRKGIFGRMFQAKK
nr:hypothetical protein HK105_004561 [Polyrhizophydium stewartii]